MSLDTNDTGDAAADPKHAKALRARLVRGLNQAKHIVRSEMFERYADSFGVDAAPEVDAALDAVEHELRWSVCCEVGEEHHPDDCPSNGGTRIRTARKHLATIRAALEGER